MLALTGCFCDPAFAEFLKRIYPYTLANVRHAAPSICKHTVQDCRDGDALTLMDRTATVVPPPSTSVLSPPSTADASTPTQRIALVTPSCNDSSCAPAVAFKRDSNQALAPCDASLVHLSAMDCLAAFDGAFSPTTRICTHGTVSHGERPDPPNPHLFRAEHIEMTIHASSPDTLLSDAGRALLGTCCAEVVVMDRSRCFCDPPFLTSLSTAHPQFLPRLVLSSPTTCKLRLHLGSQCAHTLDDSIQTFGTSASVARPASAALPPPLPTFSPLAPAPTGVCSVQLLVAFDALGCEQFLTAPGASDTTGLLRPCCRELEFVNSEPQSCFCDTQFINQVRRARCLPSI